MLALMRISTAVLLMGSMTIQTQTYPKVRSSASLPKNDSSTSSASSAPGGVLNALSSVLDFFTALKARVSRDFVDPSMREDAVKKLNLTLRSMNAIVDKNRDWAD